MCGAFCSELYIANEQVDLVGSKQVSILVFSTQSTSQPEMSWQRFPAILTLRTYLHSQTAEKVFALLYKIVYGICRLTALY